MCLARSTSMIPQSAGSFHRPVANETCYCPPAAHTRIPDVVVVTDDSAPPPAVVTVVEPEFSPCDAVVPLELSTPPVAVSPEPLCFPSPLLEPCELTVVTTPSGWVVETDIPRKTRGFWRRPVWGPRRAICCVSTWGGRGVRGAVRRDLRAPHGPLNACSLAGVGRPSGDI